MRGFVLLLLSAMLLATETLASAQTKATSTPASAGGPKPFLSAASKIITPPGPSPTPIKFVSQYRSSTPAPSPSGSPVKTVVRFRPTKDGVETPFYDVPWAVHIPIEVPFEGGGARIAWQARVSWENPPQEWPEQTFSLPDKGQGGIYRLDGKGLAQNAVRRLAAGFEALKWETDAPLPSYIWGGSYFKAFTGEKGKHKPMGFNIEDNAIVIEPVLPGWYVIWFVFDMGDYWPRKEPKREFLEGVIHFDCIVSRGLEEPTSAEKEYLFGRAKRPDKMQDDKFYIARTIDVPFKLRRDSWEFDHAEVHLIDDERGKIEKKRVALGTTQYRNYSVQEKVSGKEVELTLNEKIQDDPRDKGAKGEIPDNDSAFDTVYLADEKWKASFPPSLPDYSFGTLQLAGGLEGRYQQKGGPGGAPTYSNWGPGSLWMVRVPEGGANVWMRDVRSPMEKRFQPYEKKAREDFLHEYGNDAAEWFVPDYFEDYNHTGPKKGEPPGQYVIQATRPSLFDTAPLQLGPYPLVAFRVGPWEVCGFYKRLSEIENRVIANKAEAGETTIVSDEDDFWKWFPELSAVIAKQKRIADIAVADAALETLPLQKLLKSQKRLLFSLSQNATGGVVEGITSWLDNMFPKTGIGTLPGGSEPGSVNTPVSVSDRERTLMQNKLGEITEDIRHARERISDRTEEARAAYKAICDKLEEGNEKFGGPAHGELYIWRQQYRKIYEQIGFDIALESKDPEVLRRALADAEKESNSDRTRVLEAKLHIALGDNVGALTALRSAVEVNPQNTAAQMMLRDLECAFLKTAIDKSQSTIAEARRAFYSYMLERGFKEYHQLRTSGNWPFARAAAWTEYALDKYGEVPWAMFTTGLFGSMSALVNVGSISELVDNQGGKPAAEADLLDTVEKRMVTAFVGLNTVLRLRGKGYTFDDIKKMTSTEIRDALPLRKLNGDLYSDQDAALHRVAIRVAMEDLPDVKALVSGDKRALQLGVEKKYWNERDVGDTWLEWIGDATSVCNVLQLLPSAKVGAGARLGTVFWGEKELEAIEAYEKSGEVLSGTEFIANTIGLTDVLSQAGATDTGEAILKYLKAIGRYQEDLGWLDTVIWTTGKLTALMGIDYMTVSAGEKLGGRKGGMLMQFLMMFVRDPETLVKLLGARNIPPDACAGLIIDRYLPGTEVHIKRLVQIEKNGAELERLFERVKAGQRLMPQDQIFLDKYFRSDWRMLIPNGQASHDAEIALGAAAEGARNNVDNGAGKAVAEKMKGARQAEMEETTQAAQQGHLLAKRLQGKSPPVRGPPPPPDPPQRASPGTALITKRGAMSATDSRATKGYPLPPAPARGSASAKAEALLHLGKYKEAQDAFEDVIQKILSGDLKEADELPLEFLHLKRCLAYELQGTKKLQPNGLSKAISKKLNSAEVEEVLSNPDWWQGNPKQGVMGNVYMVQGKDYMVKTVAKDVITDVENNIVHADLAAELELDTPAIEARLVFNDDGSVQKAFYVMRKVEGKQLAELSAAEIFLFKEELSRHRALAILINDYDRKIDNYIVTADGRLFAIDAGVADVTGARALSFRGLDDQMFLEGAWGQDHWLSRSYKDEICSDLGPNAPKIELWSPNETFHRKNIVAEEALTFNAAKKTIDDIQKLVNDEPRLRKLLDGSFRKIHGTEREIQVKTQKLMEDMRVAKSPITAEEARKRVVARIEEKIQDKVKGTIDAIKARASHLDDVMRHLNKRNAITPPMARLSFPKDEIFRRVVFLQIPKHAVFRRAA